MSPWILGSAPARPWPALWAFRGRGERTHRSTLRLYQRNVSRHYLLIAVINSSKLSFPPAWFWGQSIHQSSVPVVQFVHWVSTSELRHVKELEMTTHGHLLRVSILLINLQNKNWGGCLGQDTLVML